MRLRLSIPPGELLFDHAEANLVNRALIALERKSPRDGMVLRAQLKRLGLIARALEETPSLHARATLGNRTRDERTLIARLAHFDPMGGELALPEKAVLARAFLMAKISLMRAFGVALEDGAPGEDAVLLAECKREMEQSIFTAIALEILMALLSDDVVYAPTRERAARQLILLWEGATQVEIDDFCPLLESAWHARTQLASEFGALLGTAEYLGLVRKDCPEEFLEFFTKEGVAPAEMQAFEEFLFGIPTEEIDRLRTAMAHEGRSVIDAAFAGKVLGRPLDEATTLDDPEALYRSYKRRRTAAEFRRLTRTPGPLRVAEAYMMISVLDRMV